VTAPVFDLTLPIAIMVINGYNGSMTPKQKTQAEYVTVSIRFSPETYQQLRALAIANNRSINQQVNFMLNHYLMTAEYKKEGKG
jgi:hypothetical protein